MTLKEAYERNRLERLALSRENEKLKKIINQFDSDSYTCAEKAEQLKTINKLSHEVKSLTKDRDKYKSFFQNQLRITSNINTELSYLKSDYEETINRLQNELDKYKNLCDRLQRDINSLKKSHESEIDKYEENIHELHLKIDKLTSNISLLSDSLEKSESKLNTDGTNSSLPTSKTPIGKKKIIPNSREKSGKKRGAQAGHKKHSLETLSDEDITSFEDHTLDSCPDCGTHNLEFLEKRDKDVIDYEIKVTKTRHSYFCYFCPCCNRIVHSKIPLHHKESTQYGSAIQALALSLQNVGFVSINRTKKLIDGIFKNDITLSEGYICGLQRRAANALLPFVEDMRLRCINSSILHWDDTVIFINTNRACMRFYGNERLALYKSHTKKDRIGIDDDAILGELSSDVTVIHDHLTMNYNNDFNFRNAECVQHLCRDIQKIIDITGHSWAIQTKSLISSTIHERNMLLAAGAESFSSQYISTFSQQLDKLLALAELEHMESKNRYFEEDERRLINRINKYRDSHFLWVSDFTVPPTNNLSERSLRAQKVKQKVSGQFQSITSAEYFANIRTYIETCSRNGVNPFNALLRLTTGNPYTTSELLGEE